VVEAIEGPIALTACVEHGRHDCSLAAGCSLRPHWGAVNQALRGALAAVPLSQLAAPPALAVASPMPASLEANGHLP
jgi:DNA-binding IscR family transcriptional regulator